MYGNQRRSILAQIIIRLVSSRWGLATIILGGVFAYSQFDRDTNYVPALATVTKVEESCYLTKTEPGIGTTKTYTTDKGSCTVMQGLLANHPAYKGYRLVNVTTVYFDYTSPADGRSHSGRHEQAKHKDGSAIYPRDRLPILVHKTDPEKTQRE